MAGFSLVQVGGSEELSDGDFVNLTYGCDNFESVLLDIDKTGTGTLDANPEDNFFITIQAGTETILNRVPMSALASVNKFESGTGVTTAFSVASNQTGQAYFEIDTGCHYLDKGAELSVQVVNGMGGSGDITVKAYAKVNGIAPPSPQKWLYRTDSAFMLPLVETLYVFGSSLPASSDAVTMQYGTENVLVPINAGATLVNCDTIGDDAITNMALIYDGVPRDMQINTSGSVTFLALCKEIASNNQVNKARRWIPFKLKGLSPKEKIVMAQGH